MQVATSHNAASLREAGTLNRKWHFWPVQILGSARALLYLTVGLYLGGRLIFDGLRATPVGVADVEKGILVLSALAGLIGFLYYRRTSKMAKVAATQAPSRITIETNGISIVEATGSSVFEPWSVYTGFHVGQHLIALPLINKKGFRVIPTDTLSPHEAGQLRSMLLNHLPESS